MTKILESKSTNQPELFGNLMQSFIFDEGPGASIKYRLDTRILKTLI